MQEFEAIACCDDKSFGRFESYHENAYFSTLKEAQEWVLETLVCWYWNGFASVCGNIYFDGQCVGAYDMQDVELRIKARDR